MNHSYKVIWNRSLGCFVAVAEYAKSRGKSSNGVVRSGASIASESSTAIKLSTLCLGLVAAGFSMQSLAAVGTGSIDTGNCSTAASKGTGDIAIGCGSNSPGQNAIAIGGTASTAPDQPGQTQGGQSVAIGYDAKVSGDQSVGLGANVRASGNSSIAIGGDDVNKVIDEAGTLYTQITGKILKKNDYKGTESSGAGSTAVGVQAIAKGAFSTALGVTSNATGAASVALGVDSNAAGQGALAIGAVSSASQKGSVALGINSKSSGENSIAIGSGSTNTTGANASGLNATSIGSASSAAEGATAIGAGAKATINGGVAIGTGAVANIAAGVKGFDPSTGGATTQTSNVWNSTRGAVAFGDSATGITRQLTGLAAGTNDSDAVNVAQLKTVTNQTFKVQANGDTASAVKSSDTVQFIDGDNIKVTRSGNDITVATADDLTATSFTAGSSTLNTSGLTITGGPSVTTAGISAGNKKITNVDNGTNATDAVNVGQLQASNTAANDKTDALGNSTASNLGGTATYDPTTGSVSAPTYTLDNGANTGTTITATNVGDALTNLDGRTTTNTGNIATNTANITANTDSINKGINFGDGATSNNFALGDTINVKGDSNITSTTTADGVQVSLNETVDLGAAGSFTAGNSLLDNAGLTITGGPSVTTAGISAGNKKITGVAAGTNVADAVNVGQLQASSAASDARTDELGKSTAANLGGTAAYDPTTGKVSSPAYQLDGDTVTASSVGDALTNLDGRTTTNTGNIATNTANITANTDSINKGINLGDGVTSNNFALGDTINVKSSSSNLTSTATADGIEIGLKDNLDLGATGSITAGNSLLDNAGLTITGGPSVTAAGISAGNKKITNIDNGSVTATSTDAINGGQLFGSADAIKNVIGGTATNTDGIITATNIGGTGEDTIDSAISSVSASAKAAKSIVTEGDNIKVSATTNADGSTNYQVATAKDLTVDSITAGNSLLDNSGLSITGGPSVTTAGIDAAGKKITGVAAGTAATDAVNVSQLDNVANNITASGVQYDRNTDGTVNYNRITAGNGKGSKTVIVENDDGKLVVVSGGTVITNVANGVRADDAVNKGQLDSIIANNITDVEIKDDSGKDITVNIKDQIVNTSVNQNNQESLFLTYDKQGQEVTDRLTIGETVQKMNTEGVKFAHTNARDNGKGDIQTGVTNDSSAGGFDSTAIGVNAIIASGADSTVALGHDTKASATAKKSVVIGYDSEVKGESSIAIGDAAKAIGNQSISIGTGNIVTGNNSGAIGDPTTVSGSGSYSLGNNNKVSSDDTFVLGNNITVDQKGSIVLGVGSAATTGAGEIGHFADPNDKKDIITATTSTTGAVAVGDAKNNVYRQITGVAAGTEDSDAVNVAQLKTVDSNLTNLINNIDQGSIGLVQQKGPEIIIGGTTGGSIVKVSGKEGDRQIIGVAASNSQNAAATVGQLQGITSALGGGASVNADGSIKAPSYNVQGGSQDNVGDALGALNTAINDVKGSSDALNSSAVQYDKNADGSVNKDQISLGGGKNGTTITNVANGKVEVDSKDAVNGGQLWEVQNQINQNNTDIGDLKTEINNGGLGLVKQDSNNNITVAANKGGTSINMAGTDGDRTVSGVKAGAITATSSDAINGSQLHASNNSIATALGGGAKVDDKGNLIAPEYSVAGSNYTDVGSALKGLDNKMDETFYYTNERINDVEKQGRAGIAAALSLESAPYIPGKFTYSIGAGHHRGENAVGGSLRRTADNGRWSLTGGVATDSEGGASARIGLSGVIN